MLLDGSSSDSLISTHQIAHRTWDVRPRFRDACHTSSRGRREVTREIAISRDMYLTRLRSPAVHTPSGVVAVMYQYQTRRHSKMPNVESLPKTEGYDDPIRVPSPELSECMTTTNAVRTNHNYSYHCTVLCRCVLPGFRARRVAQSTLILRPCTDISLALPGYCRNLSPALP